MTLLKASIGILLLMSTISCMKHAKVKPPVGRCDVFEGPLDAPGKQYAFWTNHCDQWFVLSKLGPNTAIKELCPKGIVCSTDVVGTMYHIQRGN